MDKKNGQETAESCEKEKQEELINETNLQEETEDAETSADSYDNMTEDFDKLKKQFDELNDSYLRLMAEFDNYRKRTLKEKAELIKSGGESVLKNLLPVVDDFERALQNIRTAEDLKAISDGIELIYNKFISYLSQEGVKAIEAVGKPFDTEHFEAIATIPAPEENLKGKVIDCVQTGYLMHEKVIRHAKVVVGE